MAWLVASRSLKLIWFIYAGWFSLSNCPLYIAEEWQFCVAKLVLKYEVGFASMRGPKRLLSWFASSVGCNIFLFVGQPSSLLRDHLLCEGEICCLKLNFTFIRLMKLYCRKSLLIIGITVTVANVPTFSLIERLPPPPWVQEGSLL